MKTQKQKILGWLQEHPNGVCSTDLLKVHIPRGAARISELRADGYKIDTVTCVEHGHRTRQIRYVLQRDHYPIEFDDWNSPEDSYFDTLTYDPEHGA